MPLLVSHSPIFTGTYCYVHCCDGIRVLRRQNQNSKRTPRAHRCTVGKIAPFGNGSRRVRVSDSVLVLLYVQDAAYHTQAPLCTFEADRPWGPDQPATSQRRLLGTAAVCAWLTMQRISTLPGGLRLSSRRRRTHLASFVPFVPSVTYQQHEQATASTNQPSNNPPAIQPTLSARRPEGSIPPYSSTGFISNTVDDAFHLDNARATTGLAPRRSLCRGRKRGGDDASWGGPGFANIPRCAVVSCGVISPSLPSSPPPPTRSCGSRRVTGRLMPSCAVPACFHPPRARSTGRIGALLRFREVPRRDEWYLFPSLFFSFTFVSSAPSKKSPEHASCIAIYPNACSGVLRRRHSRYHRYHPKSHHTSHAQSCLGAFKFQHDPLRILIIGYPTSTCQTSYLGPPSGRKDKRR